MLASWDALPHPSQIRLRSFLDRLEHRFDGHALTDAPTYLAVEVAVPPGRDILRFYDLENYLTPIAQRLNRASLRLASATKHHGGQSRVVIGIADQISDEVLPPARGFQTTCIGSAGTSTWKTALRQSLLAQDVAAAPAGAVAMHVSFACNTSRRNWANLWKSTIDSFGPVLGEPPSSPFNPADDRITSLDLHLIPNSSLVFDVSISAQWAPDQQR